MFTGIIDHNGEVTNVVKRKNSDITITVSTKFKTKDIKLGSSVCCNGVCLTVCNESKTKHNLELIG